MSMLYFKKNFFALLFMLGILHLGYAQCPNVDILEGGHATNAVYITQQWDTAVDCNVTQIKLNAEAFITTQNFNGSYLVESIPYDPPEPFTAGIHLPISSDDIWDQTGGLDIDFPFQFFGVTQTHVFMAANGLVSFNNSIYSGMASGYSWDGYYPINPSTSSPSTFPWPNSILACAGDMDPAYIPSSQSNQRGVFKFSGGEYPCRHITVSWYQVPLFGYSNQEATYHNTHQVVLYEGTNVIEVHVKNHHSVTTTTQVSGIGIINANGTSAFMAPGRNPYAGEIPESQSEAWRFTPLGTTVKTINWYRMLDNGDSIEVGANANAPNAQIAEGYYGSSDHMSCYVSPTTSATYKVTIRYNGATGYFYYLTDTIRVGVDTSTSYTINSPQMTTRRHAAACHGTQGQFNINFASQNIDVESISWEVTHTQNGRTTSVPAGQYTLGNNNRSLIFPPMTMRDNAIDTFHLYTTVVCGNGCVRSDSILYEVYPNYQKSYSDGICDNQVYEMWGEQFSQPGEYTRRFQTRYGCDSVENLHLAVAAVNTVPEVIVDCKPITWRNGVTYYESNSSTSATDTVVIQNRFGCDSIIQLNFTLVPLEARIEANPASASIDRLNIQLTDVSTGAISREWMFPTGGVNMGQVVNYNFDPQEDSVTIGLHVRSQYGCEDDTTITLHLLKENIWIPNAFTPGEETNNRFFVSCVGIVYLQMYIYDRRGELVCHYEDLDGSWDGRDTRGEICKTGTYTYVCRYANIINPNAILTKRGTITLIR